MKWEYYYTVKNTIALVWINNENNLSNKDKLKRSPSMITVILRLKTCKTNSYNL